MTAVILQFAKTYKMYMFDQFTIYILENINSMK